MKQNMTASEAAIGNYLLIKTIGTGATAKVKLAEHKTTKQLVAIKIIKKSIFEAKPNLQQKIRSEIYLMMLFNHPNILRLVEVLESRRHLYIVTEYAANGELLDYIRTNRDTITGEISMNLFRQIIYGLDFLHSHAVCHRDLKLENILLDEFNNIKVADFGFARWMKNNTAITGCGSPHYTAPEVIKGGEYDGRKADIWSAGVILYALLTGHLPFEDHTIRGLLGKVKSGHFIMPDAPPDVQNLLKRMLTVDPSNRISIAEIRRHEGFRRNLDHSYIVPSYFSSLNVHEPLDDSFLTQKVMTTLQAIGLGSEEELREALTREGPSTAKMFAIEMSGAIPMDYLLWDCAEETDGEMSSLIVESETLSITVIDSAHSIESVPGYSPAENMCEPANFAFLPVESSNMFLDIVAPIDKLMSMMQQFLTVNKFRWLHPTERTLFARRKSDNLDVIIEVKNSRDVKEAFNMEVKLPNGYVGEFEAVVSKIYELIDELNSRNESVSCES